MIDFAIRLVVFAVMCVAVYTAWEVAMKD